MLTSNASKPQTFNAILNLGKNIDLIRNSAGTLFIQAGYEHNIEADGYDGFISNIDPEWLFNCVCTFFKPDVNPIAYEYMERSFGHYDPDNDDRILPTI